MPWPFSWESSTNSVKNSKHSFVFSVFAFPFPHLRLLSLEATRATMIPLVTLRFSQLSFIFLPQTIRGERQYRHLVTRIRNQTELTKKTQTTRSVFLVWPKRWGSAKFTTIWGHFLDHLSFFILFVFFFKVGVALWSGRGPF